MGRGGCEEQVGSEWLGKRLLKCSLSKKWGKVGIQLGETKQDTHGMKFVFSGDTRIATVQELLPLIILQLLSQECG